MKKLTTTDVFGKKYEANADSLNLKIHVYGIATQRDKVLIVPQYDGYDWPGGTLHLGETHIDTLKREFKEETGYQVEPAQLLSVYTSFFHHQKRKENYQSLLIFYTVRITGGEISANGFDEDEKEYASKAKWINVDELETMRHACSINIESELIDFAKNLIKPNKERAN